MGLSTYFHVMLAVEIPNKLVFEIEEESFCKEEKCAMRDEFRHCPQCGISRKTFENTRKITIYKKPFADEDGYMLDKVIINQDRMDQDELDFIKINYEFYENGHFGSLSRYFLGVEVKEIDADDGDDIGLWWSPATFTELISNAKQRIETAGYMNSTFGIHILGDMR